MQWFSMFADEQTLLGLAGKLLPHEKSNGVSEV
jgi:hypothetical protein